MKRPLLRSTAFVRAAQRMAKHSQFSEHLRETLEQLTEDAFHPKLRTHKLKGNLEGYWACSVGYDLRIVFRFVQHEGSEAILLSTVGSREEVC